MIGQSQPPLPADAARVATTYFGPGALTQGGQPAVIDRVRGVERPELRRYRFDAAKRAKAAPGKHRASAGSAKRGDTDTESRHIDLRV